MLALLIVLPLIAALSLAAWRIAVFPLVSGARLPEPQNPDHELELKLERHVRAIASTPHHLGHPANLEAAAHYIETELASYGLQS